MLHSGKEIAWASRRRIQ